MVVPVPAHRRPQRRVGVVEEPRDDRLGLHEAEEVLGEGDLDNPGRIGPVAVVGDLLEPERDVGLIVGPEMEVVIEHGVRLDQVSSTDELTDAS